MKRESETYGPNMAFLAGDSPNADKNLYMSSYIIATLALNDYTYKKAIAMQGDTSNESLALEAARENHIALCKKLKVPFDVFYKGEE